MWILFSLIAVFVMSGSSALDSFLSNKRFSSGLALALFSALTNIVFIPIVFYIDPPGVPPLSLLPFFIIGSLLDIVYLIPYYQAVQRTDASVVSALFQFSRMFVPLFAFFIIGERLLFTDYLGFALILGAGIGLSIGKGSKLHIDKAFWLMFLSSLLVSLNVVLYKYQLERVSWGTSMIWGSLFTVPWLIMIALGFAKIRGILQASWGDFMTSWKYMILNESISFVSIMCSMYALFLAPASKASAMWGIQPFVILGLAHLLHRFKIRGVIEDISYGSSFKKFALFLVMLAGVFLIQDFG